MMEVMYGIFLPSFLPSLVLIGCTAFIFIDDFQSHYFLNCGVAATPVSDG
jgi:hypothetical protein